MRNQRTATALSDWRTRRSGRVLAYAALGGWLFTSTPGVAALASADPFAGLPRVSDARLETLRGGLRVQGYEMRFGMRVQSSVSGVGEVVTNLNWDDQRGWSPSSAYMEDAQGYGRRWDAADGQWKDYDAGPGAHGRIGRGGHPGHTGDGAPGDATAFAGGAPAPAPVTASPASTATASAASGDGPQPPSTPPASPVVQPATTLPSPGLGTGVPADADAGPSIASSGVTPPAPAMPETLAHSAGTGSPEPQAANADVAQSVAQNLAPPGSGVSTGSGQDGFDLVVANTGTTQILHQITSGHVGALITNQQNDVTIEHQVEIDLTVANFTEVVGHAMNAIRARTIVGSGLNRF